MKHSWKSRLLVFILLAATVVLAAAHAQTHPQTKTYLGVSADIPFKFAVGTRTFNRGNYQFAVLGPGLLAMLSTKSREVVHLLTRDAQLAEVPETSRLIFTRDKKGRARLRSVLVDTHAPALQIIGEEIAMRPNPPKFEPIINVDLFAPRGELTIQSPDRSRY